MSRLADTGRRLIAMCCCLLSLSPSRRAKGGAACPAPQREALTHFTHPLRVLKHADARRDVQPIVVLLASSATLSDACLSARPAGRSGRSALCVVISRQVPTCLRNHALIADRPERQRACEMGWRFPKSPGAPDYAALRVRCVARLDGGGRRGSHKTRRYAPQTSYDSFSRQPCATRPRKRD